MSVGRMEVEIVYAQSMKPLQYQGRSVHRLLGNVVLRHDSAEMRCDSAYVDQVNNTFDAFGSVHIVSSDMTINGDTLYYSGDAGEGRIVGKRVVLRDSVQRATLISDQLFFNTRDNTARYETWGVIQMGRSQLRSHRGFYDSESKVASVSHSVTFHGDTIEAYGDSLQYHQLSQQLYFWGPTRLYKDHRMAYGSQGWYDERYDRVEISREAYLDNGAQHLAADWLSADDRSKTLEARGNVLLEDSLANNRLFAPYLYYSKRSDRGYTRGRSLLFNMDSVSADHGDSVSIKEADQKGVGVEPSGRSLQVDTSLLVADALFIWGDTVGHLDSLKGRMIDTIHNFQAVGKVQVFRNDMQAVADTLLYLQRDSTFHLTRNPFPLIWVDGIQAQALRIVGYMGESTLDSVDFKDRVLVGSRDQDSTYFNQMGGNRMLAHFSNGQLASIVLREDARVIYFMRDSLELIGVNNVECPHLKVLLSDGALKGVTFYDHPTSRMLPMLDATKEDLMLYGFAWHEELQPKKRDLLRPDWLSSFEPHAALKKRIGGYRAVEGLRLLEIVNRRRMEANELVGDPAEDADIESKGNK